MAETRRWPGIWASTTGTLGNRVNADKRRRGDDGALSEDERAELARLRKENVELAMERSVALWVKDAMRR